MLSSLMSRPEASGDEKRRTSTHPLDSSPTFDRLGERGQDGGWLNGGMAERETSGGSTAMGEEAQYKGHRLRKTELRSPPLSLDPERFIH